MVRDGEALTAGPAKRPGEEGRPSPASGGNLMDLVQRFSLGKSKPRCSLVTSGSHVALSPPVKIRDANPLLTKSAEEVPFCN